MSITKRTTNKDCAETYKIILYLIFREICKVTYNVYIAYKLFWLRPFLLSGIAIFNQETRMRQLRHYIHLYKHLMCCLRPFILEANYNFTVNLNFLTCLVEGFNTVSVKCNKILIKGYCQQLLRGKFEMKLAKQSQRLVFYIHTLVLWLINIFQRWQRYRYCAPVCIVIYWSHTLVHENCKILPIFMVSWANLILAKYLLICLALLFV